MVKRIVQIILVIGLFFIFGNNDKVFADNIAEAIYNHENFAVLVNGFSSDYGCLSFYNLGCGRSIYFSFSSGQVSNNDILDYRYSYTYNGWTKYNLYVGGNYIGEFNFDSNLSTGYDFNLNYGYYFHGEFGNEVIIETTVYVDNIFSAQTCTGTILNYYTLRNGKYYKPGMTLSQNGINVSSIIPTFNGFYYKVQTNKDFETDTCDGNSVVQYEKDIYAQEVKTANANDSTIASRYDGGNYIFPNGTNASSYDDFKSKLQSIYNCPVFDGYFEYDKNFRGDTTDSNVKIGLSYSKNCDLQDSFKFLEFRTAFSYGGESSILFEGDDSGTGGEEDPTTTGDTTTSDTSYLTGLFENLGNVIGNAINGNSTATTNGSSNIKTGLENLGNYIGAGFNSLKGSSDTLGNILSGALNIIGNGMSDVGSGVNGIGDKISQAAQKTSDDIGGAINLFKEASKQTGQDIADAIDTVKQAGEQTAENISDGFSIATTAIQQTADDISNAIDLAKEASRQTGQDISNAIDTVKQAGQQTAQNISDGFGIVEQAINKTADDISNAINLSKEASRQTGQDISNAIDTVKQAGQQTAQNISDGFGIVEQAINKTADDISGAIGLVKEAGLMTAGEIKNVADAIPKARQKTMDDMGLGTGERTEIGIGDGSITYSEGSYILSGSGGNIYTTPDLDMDSDVTLQDLFSGCPEGLQNTDIGIFSFMDWGFNFNVPFVKLHINFYPFQGMACPIKAIMNEYNHVRSIALSN